MKKLCFALLVGLVVLAAVAPAAAQNRGYFSSVVATSNQMPNGTVYNRYYVPAYGTVSPSGGATVCPTAATGSTISWNATLRACAMRFLGPATGVQGYNGYIDNINKDQLGGVVHYGLHDLQTGSGTASHIGYYFWAGRAVNNTGDANSVFNGLNCAGTGAQTCLGQGNATTSTGYGLVNTPLGPINPLGGLRPIPVPLIDSVAKDPDPGTDAVINLNWHLDVKGWVLEGTDFGPATYQVTGLAKAVVGGACVAPTEVEYDAPLAGDAKVVWGDMNGDGTRDNPVVGTVLAARVSDFGKTKNDSFCYYFALKPIYTSGEVVGTVTSLYYSANSTGVVFGGLASGITGASATITKNKIVTIAWKTTLAECVQGYNVLRSFSQNGPFVKVNRTLIPDRHGPASYSYIDVLQKPEKTLWYEIEAISCDQSVARTPAFSAKKK